MSADQEKEGGNGAQVSAAAAQPPEQTGDQPGSRTQNEDSATPQQHKRRDYARHALQAIRAPLIPIIWFYRLSSTDKFSCCVAFFTFFLAIFTGLQFWAFVKSEGGTPAYVSARIDK